MASRALRKFITSLATCLVTSLPLYSETPYFIDTDNGYTSLENVKPKKKNALAILSSHRDLFTNGMVNVLNYNFRSFDTYKLAITHVSNGEELSRGIRKHSEPNLIDALILPIHGTQNHLYLTPNDSISSTELRILLNGYDRYLSSDAVILLYSCFAGNGNDNVARALHMIFNRDVAAPRLIIIPEAYLDSSSVSREFSLNSDGRLTFDYNDFTIYSRMNFNGEIQYHVLASESYGKNPLNVKRLTKPSIDEMFLILKKQD